MLFFSRKIVFHYAVMFCFLLVAISHWAKVFFWYICPYLYEISFCTRRKTKPFSRLWRMVVLTSRATAPRWRAFLPHSRPMLSGAFPSGILCCCLLSCWNDFFQMEIGSRNGHTVCVRSKVSVVERVFVFCMEYEDCPDNFDVEK